MGTMRGLSNAGVVRLLAGLLMAVGLLEGCVQGNVVRPGDCLDCNPVTLAASQVLEVELGSDRAVGTDPHDPDAYQWVVSDSGTMELQSTERGKRSDDPREFVGGYSRYVIFTLAPGPTGATQAVFDYQPTADPDGPPALSVTIDVIVTD